MRFGLSQEDWEYVLTNLVNPLKNRGARVWVFGSRARGNFKKFSDLDILYEVSNHKPLPAGFISLIKEEFENSNLPVKVDLVAASDLASSYKDSVEQDKVEL